METCSQRKAARCDLGPEVPPGENEEKADTNGTYSAFPAGRSQASENTLLIAKKNNQKGAVYHGIPKQTPRTAGSRQHNHRCSAVRMLLPAEYTNEDMRLRAQIVHCLPFSDTIIHDGTGPSI